MALTSHIAWAILNMTVLQNMTDMDYYYPHIPVLIGSPPQTVAMGVNLAGSLLAAWDGDRCPYCPGKLHYFPFVTTSSMFSILFLVQGTGYTTPLNLPRTL
jgi:hypothetical protein